MYGKKKATLSAGLARLGMSRRYRWSVSATNTYCSGILARQPGTASSPTIDAGLLITWKPRVLSYPTCGTAMVGIASISPSGAPGIAQHKISIAQHKISTAQHGTAQHSAAQRSTAQHSAA